MDLEAIWGWCRILLCCIIVVLHSHAAMGYSCGCTQLHLSEEWLIIFIFTCHLVKSEIVSKYQFITENFVKLADKYALIRDSGKYICMVISNTFIYTLHFKRDCNLRLTILLRTEEQYILTMSHHTFSVQFEVQYICMILLCEQVVRGSPLSVWVHLLQAAWNAVKYRRVRRCVLPLSPPPSPLAGPSITQSLHCPEWLWAHLAWQDPFSGNVLLLPKLRAFHFCGLVLALAVLALAERAKVQGPSLRQITSCS